MNNKTRYIELRRDGADPVGTFGARRIAPEIKAWIVSEARRSGRTHRAIVEDAIESFLRHRNSQERYSYEVIPRGTGIMYRQMISIDLLEEALEIVRRDGIFHGDLLTAAIKYQMAKDTRKVAS